jgi:hypothetical protein
MDEEHKRELKDEAVPAPVDTPEDTVSAEPAVDTGAGEVDASEAAFAASESGLPVEPDSAAEDTALPATDTSHEQPVEAVSTEESDTAASAPAPVEAVALEPVVAAVAAAGAVAASRPIWSDQGDAPFEGREGKGSRSGPGQGEGRR